MNAYYTAAAWKWQPTYNYYAQNELYHHGILGQKWGQRNGPPYPLDANAHSAAEKRLKGKNEGELDSWKAKKTAKIDKTYGSKINKLDKKIAKTTRSGKLERLKSKKADMIFKSSMKKAKIAQTTEKQYRTRKRIKTALKVAGGIAVTALAVYVANKVGLIRAGGRAARAAANYAKVSTRSDNIIKFLQTPKGKNLPIPQLNGLLRALDPGIKAEAFSAMKNAQSMLDVYQNGSTLAKLMTQLRV